MNKDNIKPILQAWHLIEALHPGEVEGIGDKLGGESFISEKKQAVTYEINLSETPWLDEELKLKKSAKHPLQFRYYMSCFKHYQIVEFMRDIFKNRDEIINYDYNTLFSFTFLVDNEGNYIKDSMFVPFLMYAMNVLAKSSNIDYGNIHKQFSEQMQLFEEKAQVTFVDGVKQESLLSIQKDYQKYFYQFNTKTHHYLRLHLNKQDTTNLNSFYLQDLAEILSKGTNKTLHEFIEGKNSNDRIDVDENSSYIEDILQPKNLPDGRWPSPVAHRLSLMQQVAVNQILSGNQTNSSVNGPPGTGKTTLLKDIFAEVVVQRAKEMILLNHPKDAFKREKTIELGGFKYPVFRLNSNLSKFSTVVASSNNGAVENISKDLPKISEIIRSSEENITTEKAYSDEAKKLSMYPSSAKKLLEDTDETWGLFSGVLGKSKNIQKFAWGLFGGNDNKEPFLQQLEQDYQNISLQDWEDAVNDFKNTLNEIHQCKNDLQEFSTIFKSQQERYNQQSTLAQELTRLQKKQETLENEKAYLEEQKELITQQINTLPKTSFWKRLFKKTNTQEAELNQELNELIQQLREINQESRSAQENISKKIKTKQKLDKELASFEKRLNTYRSQNITLPFNTYWADTKEAYENRQESTLWITDELNFKRGLLFIKAMKIHKVILAFNFHAIKTNLRLLINRSQFNLNLEEHRDYLNNMWKSIHLITPVVSTTFASFSSMYKGMKQDTIDYLFIDEAGQANPQEAAGALWRSKKAIIVGDPLQIEPVVTIDSTILEDIKNNFELEDKYIGTGSSVQSIADLANRFGTFKNEEQWIGIPLWVHRRCLNPMFTISNKIAYDNKMVLANKKTGRSIWFDCKGTATNRQYVKEQGEFVTAYICNLWKETEQAPNVYIITPFTAIRSEVKTLLKIKLIALGHPKVEVNSWVDKSVGTVHTFQGKEADTVFFITGTDENSDGAANWSCSKPNLINVAVTRAKKEFFIIGDYQRFAGKPHYSTIRQMIGEIIDTKSIAKDSVEVMNVSNHK